MANQPTQNRTPREAESREAAKRVWQPAELLPEPVKEPGMAYRWIRGFILSATDPVNVSSKLREGWEPVSIEEQPHMAIHESQDLRFRGNIEVGGLILCKMPQEMVDQRAEYYLRATRAQAESVDNNYMRENDPRMPLFSEKKTKVTFGTGS